MITTINAIGKDGLHLTVGEYNIAKKELRIFIYNKDVKGTDVYVPAIDHSMYGVPETVRLIHLDMDSEYTTPYDVYNAVDVVNGCRTFKLNTLKKVI